ncbi:MAG: type IV secretory system conjugative DNA transfer family protein [Clostridiales bacterium]|nr:type IV secretory system conjugative DNA transfer family protein [Clostridiales bacterium]
MNKPESSYRILGADYIVSNDTRKTRICNNDCILGQSGTGKTGSYVIPNIQILDHSLIVSDTKCTLYEMCKDDLIARGFKVSVLDFVHPEKSCPYNPLSHIKRFANGKYREQDVLSLADSLVPAMDKKEPFWEMAARTYIAYLIGYVLETLTENSQNLYQVSRMHRLFTIARGDGQFYKHAAANPNNFSSRKYQHIRSTMIADRTWACISEFATQALSMYDTNTIYNMIGRGTTFDIRSLGREKQVLFMNVSDTDRTYDGLINSFYTQALQVLCAEADSRPEHCLEVPVRFILDDFATNAKIQDFDKIISVIRSREIYVSIILQCISQLDSLYGRSTAKTIFNNCDHIIYLGGHDYETAEYIASLAYTSTEKVLTLPPDKEYILETGKRGRLIDRIRPYSTL